MPGKPAQVTTAITLPTAMIDSFCQRWKIAELAVFGSVLREDFGPESDVDVLVTFEAGAAWSLLDLVGMEYDLERRIGRRADIVERTAVEASPNPIRRDDILSGARTLYEAR